MIQNGHILSVVFRFNDSDQFKDPDLYSDKSDRENEQEQEEWENEVMEKSEESDSDTSERQEDSYVDLDETLRETPYIEQTDEELGEVRVFFFICKSLILRRPNRE